jgi:hypothetical protein
MQCVALVLLRDSQSACTWRLAPGSSRATPRTQEKGVVYAQDWNHLDCEVESPGLEVPRSLASTCHVDHSAEDATVSSRGPLGRTKRPNDQMTKL